MAVIGAGYTGLSCAYHLASRWDIEPVVLEANRIGWGCSGRNAGFVLSGTGRLGLGDYQHRWGKDTAKLVYSEFRQGVDNIRYLAEQGPVDCQLQDGGYLKLAHSASMARKMARVTDNMRREFGDTSRWLTQQQARSHILSPGVYGATLTPYSFGINPLRMAENLAAMAKNAGANIYTGSPVTDWQRSDQGYRLFTPQGEVQASKVVIASNGYTLNRFHPALDGRHFPVLSSVLVTQPLSQQQQQACGLTPGPLFMDSRQLKYYYRLLPDGRLLFGGRGAITGKAANHPRYQNHLKRALAAWLPATRDIGVEHFWSGWVSVALDNYPRVGPLEDNLYAAMGYCGAGVSFATLAGQRLAETIAQGPNSLPDLPFYQTPLPKFPLPRLRRLGLKAFYHWAQWRDG
ncbi:NAD(P)/FAD-dependent oxidoreductase [Saliniradius amylolyticus]|uniref:NAD(P)/FAD-dependent oxidoreductase n=1 Tax=Saliniradius amylolyticus TaxID=2183582 RepID=UPI0013A58D67|nr:FAD-binding oxidoreductase [Saliniradius amylolyticus]